MKIRVSSLTPENYFIEDDDGVFVVPAEPGGWHRRRRFLGSVRTFHLIRGGHRCDRIIKELQRN